MIKRKYDLSISLINKLNIICNCYKIDKATFIRMAIYHGIKYVSKGYIPIRKTKPKKKIQYPISLPKDTWDALRNAKDIIKKNYEKSISQRTIPLGELIEIFIRIEIRKYYFLYDCYCKDDQFDDSKMFDEHEEINIRTSIPHIFYEKISEIEKTTGLSHTQIYKYLIINSLLDEDCHVDAKVIVTDIDMIDYAHELGLSYLKLLMFLNAMVKSNKILFIEDNDNH